MAAGELLRVGAVVEREPSSQSWGSRATCPQLPHPARPRWPHHEAPEGFGLRKRNIGATNCDVWDEEEKFWGYNVLEVDVATITPLLLAAMPRSELVTAREVPWDGGARFGGVAHGH